MSTNVKPMKQYDTLPVLEVRCRFKDPAEDLTASVTTSTPVVFIMRDRHDRTATPIINRQPAAVVSSTASVVTLRYEWADGDTDIIGEYWGEFELDIGGEPLTAPTNGYVLVRIEDDLDNDTPAPTPTPTASTGTTLLPRVATGYYSIGHDYGATGITISSGTTWSCPIDIPAPMTVTRVYCWTFGTPTGMSARMGLYTYTPLAGDLSDLIVDGGLVAMGDTVSPYPAGNGPRYVDFAPVALPAGTVCAVIRNDSAPGPAMEIIGQQGQPTSVGATPDVVLFNSTAGFHYNPANYQGQPLQAQLSVNVADGMYVPRLAIYGTLI